MVFPSGEQFEIARGDQRATVVEVGGGLRSYEQDGRDVIHPYAAEAICDGAHGAPLIPWPNRLADGRYAFDGKECQVALTEPPKANAIHGFLRWRNWNVLERADDRVTVGTRLHPLMGWPHALDVAVTYSLQDGGLAVQMSATNVGQSACPYACGQHPYLSPGEVTVDECTLELRAATRILTDSKRQLPIGREAVDGTDYDFRSPRSLRGLEVDHAFTDLERDPQGQAWVRLGCPDGRTAELWVDEAFPVVEIYTADTLTPARRRKGLGAEPMTCPPNGLQSGEMIVRLEPGETHVGNWGVRLG